MYIGLLLLFFNIPLLVLSLFAIVMFHLQIVYAEEPFLMKAFGTEYQAYSQTVRRYLGREVTPTTQKAPRQQQCLARSFCYPIFAYFFRSLNRSFLYTPSATSLAKLSMTICLSSA